MFRQRKQPIGSRNAFRHYGSMQHVALVRNSIRQKRYRAVVLTMLVLIFIVSPTRVLAYQSGGALSSNKWTMPSGLALTATNSSASWPGPASMSARNYNHGAGTYVLANGLDVTSAVNSQMGLNWTVKGTGCSMPSGVGTTTGCSKGTTVITFSQPVKNPTFFINDIGGAFDAGCFLGISGKFAISAKDVSGSSISSASFRKTNTSTGNGAANFSGGVISAPSVPTDSYQTYHANGSIAITGTIIEIQLVQTVDIKRTNSTACSYGTGNLDYLEEQITVAISSDEDFGDGPASYDSVAAGNAASNVIGDLALGASLPDQEFASAINTSSARISSATSGGEWSTAANLDTDDAIAAGSLIPGTQQLSEGIMLNNGYSLTIPISGAGVGGGAYKAGNLCGFIDLNNDGKYTTSNPNESACATYATGAKSASITWDSSQWPAGANPADAVGLRLRTAYGAAETLSPNSLLASGETEDYLIALLPQDPPVALPVSASGSQGVAITMATSVSQGAPSAALTCIVSSTSCVSTLTVPGQGSFAVNPNGTITFTPEANFIGIADPITYRVEDTAGQSDTATMTATIVAAPVANVDSSSGSANTVQHLNLLANDTVASGQSFVGVKLCDTNETAPNCTATSLSFAEGLYSLDSATGELTFTPAANYVGSPTPLTYVIEDSLGARRSSSVDFTVNPLPASALADSTRGTVGSQQSANLVTNDTLSTSGTLSFVYLCGSNEVAPNCSNTSVTRTEGTYSVNTTSGEVTFTPFSGYTGVPSSPIEYVVIDSNGERATATYTPTVIAAPIATSDTSLGTKGQVQSFDLLDNDTLQPTTNLSSVKLCLPTDTPPECNSNSITTADGSYVVDPATGAIAFTPVASFVGTPMTAVTYVITDNLNGKATGDYLPTVAPSPVAVNDFTNALAGEDQTVNVLSNDTIDRLTNFSNAYLCSIGETAPSCSSLVVSVTGGQYSVDSPTGLITFTPAVGYAGTPTPAGYVIVDALGGRASAMYQPEVNPSPTVVRDDVSFGGPGATQSLNLVTNDVIATGETLSGIKLCDNTEVAPVCASTTLTTIAGTYSIAPDGTMTFVPAQGYFGTPAPIIYVASDSGGGVDQGTYTPTVAGLPTAMPDSKSILTGTLATTIDPLDNDSAFQGVELDVTSVLFCDPTIPEVAPACTATALVLLGKGRFEVSSVSGVVSFTPEQGFEGDAGPISYQVSDEFGSVATSTLTISVFTPASQQPLAPGPQEQCTPTPTTECESSDPIANLVAPVLVEDFGQTRMGESVLISVFDNDTLAGIDLGNFRFEFVFDGVSHENKFRNSSGLWENLGKGIVRFTPTEKFTGISKIEYQLVAVDGEFYRTNIEVEVAPEALAYTGADDATGTIATSGFLLMILGAFMTFSSKNVRSGFRACRE